jgi:transcription regulator MmyB-like protein
VPGISRAAGDRCSSQAGASGWKTFAHPLVGEFTTLYQSLQIPQEVDQYLSLYLARTGSPAAEKLALLSIWNPKPVDFQGNPEPENDVAAGSVDVERRRTED